MDDLFSSKYQQKNVKADLTNTSDKGFVNKFPVEKVFVRENASEDMEVGVLLAKGQKISIQFTKDGKKG